MAIITILKLTAIEKSTFVVVVAFKDEDGGDVTPNAGTVTWTLTDAIGNVINGKENQAIDSANPLNIVLTGNDLLIQASETVDEVERRLIVSCKYDSDLGNDLPLKDSCGFRLRDVVWLAS